MDLTNTLGNRIKDLRKENRLSQIDLAQKLNISNTTLSQYETGQRVPSDDIKIKIAGYFDVSLDYLLGTTNDRGGKGSGSKKNPLANEQGDRIIRRALKDTDLLSADGTLSAEGEDVISAFLKNNAEILKKLIKEDD